MSNVRCFKAFDAFTLLAVLDNIGYHLEKQKEIQNNNDENGYYSKLQLIIIDSMASVIGPILGGGQTIGHAIMMNISRTLKNLALKHNIAFLLTNYAVIEERGDKKKKAGLGESWAYVPNTQLFFHNDVMNNTRHAVVTKSSYSGTGTRAYFQITDVGVCDL